MQIEKYLGKNATSMLQENPFKDWVFEKSVETDLEEPIIQYDFVGHGLELRCDQDNKISVIFIHSDHEALFAFPFSWKREQILERFGPPSKSGRKTKDPILGEFGEWDRFDRADYAIHIEYRTDCDSIKKITLMRTDLVP
jgi:hypothetical protein